MQAVQIVIVVSYGSRNKLASQSYLTRWQALSVFSLCSMFHDGERFVPFQQKAEKRHRREKNAERIKRRITSKIKKK